MAYTIEQGVIQNLTTDEKKGHASCQVNNIPVNLHRDLTTNINNGDEVELIGIMQNDEMRALAVRDITNNNINGIDTTNYIMLMGIGLYIFTMFSVFFVQGLMHHANMPIEVMHTVISMAGLAWALTFLRNIIRSISALNQIKRMAADSENSMAKG